MSYRTSILLLLLILEFYLSSQLKSFAMSTEDWQKLVNLGNSQKFDGKYQLAIQTFNSAITVAEKDNLPTECLIITLCRLADAEVITNQIAQADLHFQKIINLYRQKKTTAITDPKVKFWIAVLSDSYMSNTKPETREICLKHACYLKDLIYGSAHKECIGCLNNLAIYYIDQEKIDKAIQTLTINQAITNEKYSKNSNPNVLTKTLDQLAIKCRNEHKYHQAEQLELAAIKSINRNSVDLYLSLPTYYCFAGMNALAQGKTVESNEYFNRAIQECLKITDKKKKDITCQYLGSLNQFLLDDIYKDKRLVVAESEARNLLKVYESLHTKPFSKYAVTSVLANILDQEKKSSESIKLILQCIELAKLPQSNYQSDIPEHYMHIAAIQASALGQMNEANKTYAQALNAEEDKTGAHATLILFWWGYYLERNRCLPLAIAKLHLALKQARELVPAKRGSLLADTLQMLALIETGFGRKHNAQILFQQSAKEIEAQKIVNPKLWPNIYGR